jgi:hypothetical protein
MAARTQSIPFVVPPQSVPAVDPQIPKHFFPALDSGWSVVPDSVELGCFEIKNGDLR